MKKNIKILFVIVLLLLPVISAAAEKTSNLPEPIKNFIDSFSGTNIWGGLKSVIAAINKFFVEKFNLSLERVFKAAADVIIWLAQQFINLLSGLKNKV